MLPSWMIEKLRKEKSDDAWQPVPLELPVPMPYWPEPEESSPVPEMGGVIVIDML